MIKEELVWKRLDNFSVLKELTKKMMVLFNYISEYSSNTVLTTAKGISAATLHTSYIDLGHGVTNTIGELYNNQVFSVVSKFQKLYNSTLEADLDPEFLNAIDKTVNKYVSPLFNLTNNVLQMLKEMCVTYKNLNPVDKTDTTLVRVVTDKCKLINTVLDISIAADNDVFIKKIADCVKYINDVNTFIRHVNTMNPSNISIDAEIIPRLHISAYYEPYGRIDQNMHINSKISIEENKINHDTVTMPAYGSALSSMLLDSTEKSVYDNSGIYKEYFNTTSNATVSKEHLKSLENKITKMIWKTNC